MAGLSATAIADFVETTNEATQTGFYQDVTDEFHQFEFVGRVVPQLGRKKKKTRSTVQGTGIKWFVGVTPAPDMEETGLYAPTTGTNTDHTKSMKVEMAMGRSHWQYDDREAAFQGTSVERLLDYLQVREDYAKRTFAIGMEKKWWQGASVSTASPPNFIRLIDWIQMGSVTAFGFNGSDPAGWAAGLGGLSRATYTGLKNGTGRFTVMDDGDLFPLWEKAKRHCHFIGAIDYKRLVDGMPDHVYYTGDANITEYQTYLTLANDNLKVDAGRYRGMSQFKGSPVCWVDALDAVAARPIYGINWKSFEYVELPGYGMKRNRPMPVGAHQEHVWRVVNNWIGQTICYDPRSNFVLHWVAS
jgi:hypothetical protein